MAFSYDFKDNVVYGADHINAIRTSILTKGVIEESATSCKVLADESGIKIASGQAVFADGCRIEIDEDGFCPEITQGQTNYIYFYNNTLAGVCEVRAETEIPSGDFVLLAEIDAEGKIIDKRQFAQLKTADSERFVSSFTANLQVPKTASEGQIIGQIELPKSGCSYVEFECAIGAERVVNVRVFPKENGYVLWRYWGGAFYAGEIMEITVYSKPYYIKFEPSGNILTLRMMSSPSEGEGFHNMTVAGYCTR